VCLCCHAIDRVDYTHTVWLNRHPAGAEPLENSTARSLSNAVVTSNLTAEPVAVEQPRIISVGAPTSSSTAAAATATATTTEAQPCSNGELSASSAAELQQYTWEFGEVGAVHSDSSSDSGSESGSDDSENDDNDKAAATSAARHTESGSSSKATISVKDDEQLEKHEIRMQLPLAALQAGAGAATSFELVFDEHTAPVIRKLATTSAL
jgi:hypothetical protein